MGPLSGWGPGQNAPVAPPVGGPDYNAQLLIDMSFKHDVSFNIYITLTPQIKRNHRVIVHILP